MQPFEKRLKKRSRKAGGESQPVKESAIYASKDNYLSYLDNEKLVDYEPESSLLYLGDGEEISPDIDWWPAHGDGPATNI
jgi:hypothetical protein